MLLTRLHHLLRLQEHAAPALQVRREQVKHKGRGNKCQVIGEGRDGDREDEDGAKIRQRERERGRALEKEGKREKMERNEI